MDKIFCLATLWNTFYELGVDDGQGNVPVEIKPCDGYHEIIFEHGKFAVQVYAVAYTKYGDWEKIKPQPKPESHLKVVKEG